MAIWTLPASVSSASYQALGIRDVCVLDNMYMLKSGAIEKYTVSGSVIALVESYAYDVDEMVFSANKLFAYAISKTAATVSSYSVDASGTLRLLNTQTLSTVGSIALSHDGKYLYVATQTGAQVFLLGFGGSLYPTVSYDVGVTLTCMCEANGVLYAAVGTDVFAYQIQGDVITPLGGKILGLSATSIFVHDSYLYMTNGSSSLFIYALSANGDLIYVGQSQLPSAAQKVRMTADGSSILAVSIDTLYAIVPSNFSAKIAHTEPVCIHSDAYRNGSTGNFGTDISSYCTTSPKLLA